MWDTGIEKRLKPIAKMAIHAYGDGLVSSDQKDLEVTMSGYPIKMHCNEIINDAFAREIFKVPEDVEFQVNVEIGIRSATSHTVRWFVGIYYKYKDGQWLDESKSRLTTYELSTDYLFEIDNRKYYIGESECEQAFMDGYFQLADTNEICRLNGIDEKNHLTFKKLGGISGMPDAFKGFCNGHKFVLAKRFGLSITDTYDRIL